MKLTANKTENKRVPTWAECCSALSAEQRAAERLLQSHSGETPVSEIFAAARKKLSENHRAILRAIRPALLRELNLRAWARGLAALQKKQGDEFLCGELVDGDDDNLTEKYPGLFSITADDYAAILRTWKTGGEELRTQYAALLCIPSAIAPPPETRANQRKFITAVPFQSTMDLEKKYPKQMDDLYAKERDKNGVTIPRENFGTLDSIGYKGRKLAIIALAEFAEVHKTPDAARKIAIAKLRKLQAVDKYTTAADARVYVKLPLSEFMRRAGFSHRNQVHAAIGELAFRAIPYSALRIYKKGGKTIRAAAFGSATFKAILVQGENEVSPANRKQIAPRKAITVRIGIPAAFVMHPRYVFFLPDGVQWADILPALHCDGDISLFMHLSEKMQRGDGGRADITDDDLRRCYAADIAAARKRGKGELTAARANAERIADKLRDCGLLKTACKSTGAEWQIACTSDIAHARRLSAK